MSEFALARVDAHLKVTHGSDDALYVEFYNEAVHNAHKSELAGRPIHDDQIFVRIVVPGGKTTVERPIKEEDKVRFPRQWAHFQAQGTTGGLIGTPLKEWVALSKAQVADLNAIGIFTVDQLAVLTDHGIQAVGMGGRELKAKAQAFLAQAAGEAPLESLAADNVRLAEDLERAEDTIEALAAQIEVLTRRMDGHLSAPEPINRQPDIPAFQVVGAAAPPPPPVGPLFEAPPAPVMVERRRRPKRRRGRPRKAAAPKKDPAQPAAPSDAQTGAPEPIEENDDGRQTEE